MPQMIERPLDLDAVRAFITVAELGSFTRAAEALETTQGAISLRLRRLEERLGARLLERTPRYVELSAKGAAFLPQARALLDAHDRALATFAAFRTRLAIGISDHVAGPELAVLVARVNARHPEVLIEIRIGSSGDLLQAFDRRELDAAIVRLHTGRHDGELIAEESFGWFAGPTWHPRDDEPLAVATMAEPCGVRVLAGQLLDAADVSWREAFVGGGVAAVTAAVMAGLGVAALAQRMLPPGAVDVGARLALPALPRLPLLLHARVAAGPARAALDMVRAAYRDAAQT